MYWTMIFPAFFVSLITVGLMLALPCMVLDGTCLEDKFRAFLRYHLKLILSIIISLIVVGTCWLYTTGVHNMKVKEAQELEFQQVPLDSGTKSVIHHFMISASPEERASLIALAQRIK